MGFWQDLTGQTAKKNAKEGYAASSGMLKTGYDDSTGYINTGYSKGSNALLDAAGNYQSAYNDASGMAQGGYNASMQTIDGMMGANGGGNAGRMYADALGANGLEAQQGFGANYAASDPFRQGNEDRATNALMRSMQARGMADSGLSRIAAARGSLERGSQDWGNYLDRLRGLGDQNQQLGMQKAGMQYGFGNNQADRRTGLGQNLAGNNVLLANAGIQQGGDLAGLATDYAHTSAGNRINLGNALTQASQSGVNNMMNIAGTVAKVVAASDIRLKRDIVRIGETPGGLSVYRFRYRGADDDGREHVGVMAQDVQKTMPHAIVYRADGMMMVNYGAIV